MNNKAKILIADDTPSFGMACAQLLKNDGYETILCKKDGERVVTLAQANHFDVIVMDVFMPQTDAIGVLERLRESGAQQPLVILISGVDNPSFESQMIGLGADYYFIKPVSAQAVASRIRQLLTWRGDKKLAVLITQVKTKSNCWSQRSCTRSACLLTLKVTSICAQPSFPA